MFKLLENKHAVKWMLFIFSFLLYSPTINNKFSMDDDIVTVTNIQNPNHKLVTKGIGGIPEIFRSHYIENKHQKYDYRPFVVATYAVEWSIFKGNVMVSHIINILLYSLTCIVLYTILLLVIKNNILSILITVLFIVHPLHSEVVCSLKNRDELLSFLAGICIMYNSILFVVDKKRKYLICSGVLLFVAYLNKPTAILYIPVSVILASVFVNNKEKWRYAFSLMSVFVITHLLFAITKNALVGGTDVRDILYFENPLFFEKNILSKISASLYILWFYFKMHFLPYPLSFYYGYNQIPIAGWNNTLVWLSLIIHVALFYFAIHFFRKKSILGIFIALYLITILPFSNIIKQAPGIVAERFTMLSSLFFLCSIVFTGYMVYNKIKGRKTVLLLLFFLMVVFYSVIVIKRIPDWKTHLTLYRNDIKHLDNSAKAHALLAGAIYPALFKMPNGQEKDKLIKECEYHYIRSLEIFPDYIVSNNNLGSIYFTFYGDYKKAKPFFLKAIQLDSAYVEAHYNLAYSYEMLGDYPNAIINYEKTLALSNSEYFPAFNRLTNLYFETGRPDKVIEINNIAANKFPDNTILYVNIANAYSSLKDTASAINFFIKAFEIEPRNRELCMHISKVYAAYGNTEMAEKYYLKAIDIK